MVNVTRVSSLNGIIKHAAQYPLLSNRVATRTDALHAVRVVTSFANTGTTLGGGSINVKYTTQVVYTYFIHAMLVYYEYTQFGRRVAVFCPQY